MPTTIIDSESYPEALQRRYAEELKNDKKIIIKALARKAGFFEFNIEGWLVEFEEFVNLVRADALEEAAKFADDYIGSIEGYTFGIGEEIRRLK